MSVWTVRGGRQLQGSVRAQGSKNAVLPILAASALGACVTELENCPRLSDVECSVAILRELGCQADWVGNTLIIDSRGELSSSIPGGLMERMRSSVLFLGALLGREKEAKGSMPGGCLLGDRPIDYHLLAFRALGAEVEERGSEILCRASALRGAEITLPGKSVGATENTLLAACGAEGKTVIRNASAEPEILSLCRYLRALGADIEGEGSETLRISGFHPGERVHFRIPSDRIEAATWLCFASASRGSVTLENCPTAELAPLLRQLHQLGAELETEKNRVKLSMLRRPSGSLNVCSEPYPGFPTDALPLLLAVCCTAEGESSFRENIFNDRLRYVPALRDMGADIQWSSRHALVRGVETLRGTTAEGTDLRGSAALLCAALGAEGITTLHDAFHLERGYESMENRLAGLGAEIKKE